MLDALIDRVADLARRVDAAPTTSWATVTSLDPVRVQLGGHAGPLPVTPAMVYHPRYVGERVLCLLAHRRVTIIGSASQGLIEVANRDALPATGVAEGTLATETEHRLTWRWNGFDWKPWLGDASHLSLGASLPNSWRVKRCRIAVSRGVVTLSLCAIKVNYERAFGGWEREPIVGLDKCLAPNEGLVFKAPLSTACLAVEGRSAPSVNASMLNFADSQLQFSVGLSFDADATWALDW